MIEQWFELTLESGPRPALVLDTSESAAKIAPFLRSLVEGILEEMPESSRPNIFFLGNPQPHDPARFSELADQWFRDNAGRGSFIGPIFESLEAEPDLAMVVAGAGRIFDLADWRDHPLARATTWMKVGPVGLTDGLFPESMYACEQLAELLHHPLLHVEVSGPGVMPIWWDDPSFVLNEGRLVGQRARGRLRLGVLSPQPDAAAAAVVRANGKRRSLRLEPGEPAAAGDEIRLPHAEFMLLRQCRNKNSYHCPVCGKDHPADQRRCDQNPAVPLFPTLEALPSGGFAILDTGSWETRLQPHPHPVLRLTFDTVAVREASGAQVLRFDPASTSWKPIRAFMLFEQLEDRRYAMVL